MSQLLKTVSPLLTIQRSLKFKNYNWPGGVQYPGFKYYPRDIETFKDPPYEPSKLFRVELIKPIKGLSKFEREILQGFQLLGKVNSFSIVKNIPENNHRLWKIKHVVQIKPITFPDGFPKENDVTHLKQNGELRIVKQVGIEEKQLELSEKFLKEPNKLDGDTLRRHSRMKWLSGWD